MANDEKVAAEQARAKRKEKRKKLKRELKEKKKNLRFNDCVKIAEAFGFRFERQSGSHQIYKHPRIQELLNLQEVSGKAKPYQVSQLLNLIDEYELLDDDNEDAE